MSSVTLKRGTKTEIENTQIQDGQLLFETDQLNNNKIYIDLPNGERVPVGGSGAWVGTTEELELAIQDDQIADGTQVIVTNDYQNGMVATNVIYNNSDSGLVSTNVQGAIDEVVDDIDTLNSALSNTTIGVGSRSASKISFVDNWSIQTSGQTIPFDRSIQNTNESVFTSADGLGCLIKQKGIYSVRIRIHGLINANHEINFYLNRFKSGEDVVPYIGKIEPSNFTRQFTVDETFIIRNDSNGNDRVTVVIYSSASGDFIYGTRDAGDTYLEVTKIANIE